jgi:YHS domain-containing protein
MNCNLVKTCTFVKTSTLLKLCSLLLSILAVASPACRSTNESTAGEASAAPRAQCPVCVAEGDLGCVEVKVLAETPSSKYLGRTYWFCSEECRSEFEKHPNHYVRP